MYEYYILVLYVYYILVLILLLNPVQYFMVFSDNEQLDLLNMSICYIIMEKICQNICFSVKNLLPL